MCVAFVLECTATLKILDKLIHCMSCGYWEKERFGIQSFSLADKTNVDVKWDSIEAAGNRHNEFYSVNYVRIDCSSGNTTVFRSPQVFDERIS